MIKLLRRFVLVGVLFYCGIVLGADAPVLAPDFAIQTREGHMITRASLAGKPTLMVFWASSCEVCREELPKIHQLFKKTQGTLGVVAIGFLDGKEAIMGYVKSHAETFSFPTAYDKNDQVAETFRVRATPTLFLLDQEGRIVLTYRGGGLIESPHFPPLLKKLGVKMS